MSPRKRSKPNPKAEAESHITSDSQEIPSVSGLEVADESRTRDSTNVALDRGSEKEKGDGTSTPQSAKSWYGGTWPRGNKVNPVTRIAKESISVAKEMTSEAVVSASARTPPLPSTPLRFSPAHRKLGNSSRSLPLAATTTKLNIASNGHVHPQDAVGDRKSGDQEVTPSEDRKSDMNAAEQSKAEPSTTSDFPASGMKDDKQEPNPGNDSVEAPKKPRESAGWMAWFAKAEEAEALRLNDAQSETEAQKLGSDTRSRPQSHMQKTVKPEEDPRMHRRNSEPISAAPTSPIRDQPRSWLNLWGNTASQSKPSSFSAVTGTFQSGNGGSGNSTPNSQTPDQTREVSERISQQDPGLMDSSKSLGWAFWSKETGGKKSGGDAGELALAGSPSQSRPEKDTVDEAKGLPNKVGKRQRPPSLDVPSTTSKISNLQEVSKKDEKPNIIATATKDPPGKTTAVKKKRESQNLLLPSFKDTYLSVSRPGLIQQLSRWFQFASFSHPRHVDIVTSPPRIKRALAIGVHGYFPTPLVRSLLGQPTGTSIRFADSAASAIQRWTQAQGYSCEVEKVALEGEGKIAERIELLWKLMLNWIDKIRKADFVMVACHSQGCPVALMLVAKLISFGCVSAARIGVCAMAGVNLGPFVDYKSRWISGSAGELFDFARSDSKVSMDYTAALDVALKFGVKIVYVGSIDDQLVSLEVGRRQRVDFYRS